EVVANLVYERIEKHCSCCFRLDHELRDYLKAKAAKREAQASGSDNPRDRSQAASSSGRHSRQYQQRTATTNPGRSENFDRNNGYQHNRETRHNMWYNESHMLNLRSNRDSYEKATAPRNSHNRRYQPYAQERNNLRSATYQEIYRPVQRTSNQSPPPPPLPVRDRLSLRPPVRTEPDHGESSFCQNSNPNHSKGVLFHETQLEVPAEALNVAREELRDVMVQYTSCVDPSESAARKERLRQAEENGQIEESIALMAQQTETTESGTHSNIPERTSALLRLSSPVPPPNPPGKSPDTSTGRASALLRLGHPPQEAGLPSDQDMACRKPGRPHGTKKVSNSPKTLTGASSRKR
ncbi:hypothetical protein HID58_033462, partial [Brassica napus]